MQHEGSHYVLFPSPPPMEGCNLHPSLSSATGVGEHCPCFGDSGGSTLCSMHWCDVVDGDLFPGLEFLWSHRFPCSYARSLLRLGQGSQAWSSVVDSLPYSDTLVSARQSWKSFGDFLEYNTKLLVLLHVMAAAFWAYERSCVPSTNEHVKPHSISTKNSMYLQTFESYAFLRSMIDGRESLVEHMRGIRSCTVRRDWWVNPTWVSIKQIPRALTRAYYISTEGKYRCCRWLCEPDLLVMAM